MKPPNPASFLLIFLFSTYSSFLLILGVVFEGCIFEGEGAEKYMDGVVGKGLRRLILLFLLGSFSGFFFQADRYLQ